MDDGVLMMLLGLPTWRPFPAFALWFESNDSPVLTPSLLNIWIKWPFIRPQSSITNLLGSAARQAELCHQQCNASAFWYRNSIRIRVNQWLLEPHSHAGHDLCKIRRPIPVHCVQMKQTFPYAIWQQCASMELGFLGNTPPLITNVIVTGIQWLRLLRGMESAKGRGRIWNQSQRRNPDDDGWEHERMSPFNSILCCSKSPQMSSGGRLWSLASVVSQWSEDWNAVLTKHCTHTRTNRSVLSDLCTIPLIAQCLIHFCLHGSELSILPMDRDEICYNNSMVKAVLSNQIITEFSICNINSNNFCTHRIQHKGPNIC